MTEEKDKKYTVSLPIKFETMKEKNLAGITGRYLIITNKDDKTSGRIILEPDQQRTKILDKIREENEPE